MMNLFKQLVFCASMSVAVAAQAQVTPLHDAALAGDMKLATELIKGGALVNQARPDGSQPIHGAAASGNIALIEMLLKNGADVNARSKSGITPLYLAALKGDSKVVAWLLTQKADVTAKKGSGESALFPAAAKGNIEVLDLLVKAGVNPGQNNESGVTLAHAAVEGGVPAMKWVIQKGLNINAREQREGRTPLHWAVLTKRDEVGAFLISNGAEIGAVDKFGATPLHAAAMANDVNMAKALVSKGVDLSIKTKDGQTALDIAKKKDSTEVVTFLGTLGK